jgi:hypothetical protein
MSDGVASLRLFVWGLNDLGRKTRELKQESLVLHADLQGQYKAMILEGGTIVLPYGSQGFASRHRWDGGKFENVGD